MKCFRGIRIDFFVTLHFLNLSGWIVGGWGTYRLH